MFICAAGDIHGAMDRLYDEESLGVRFDYVLRVGDFGTWPDPDREYVAARGVLLDAPKVRPGASVYPRPERAR